MKKIMILDSHTQDLMGLNVMLSHSFIVLSCSRWTKTLDILQVYQPSGLILDPHMPGFEAGPFIQQARSISQLPYLVVAAVSHLTNLSQINEVFGWGVDFAFSKPVQPQAIIKKMEVLMTLKQRDSLSAPMVLRG
jgi:PleD family two-component response regulator